jgi:hypothetical protein
MVKIKLYTPDYKEELDQLLKGFSSEVWDEGTADTDMFVNSHWAIYIALIDDVVIGFSSYFINTYFGLRPPTLGNTYIYVKPEHRTSKVMYLFSLQSGKIATELQMPLEHYYSSKESLKLSSKLKGTKMYEAWIYEIDEVEKTFNKLKNKVRIE